MTVLLDTDVLWQLRGGPGADPMVLAWAARQPRSGLFVSALALAELGTAARDMDRANRAAAAAVRQWIDGPVLSAFEGRVVAVDAAVAARGARLAHPNFVDGLLAATALEHGLTLATRTPAAFKATRVKLIDPGNVSADPPGADGDDWRQASRGGPVWLRNLFARG